MTYPIPIFQRLRPYIWIIFILGAVAGGEYYFYRFSFDPENTFQLSRGVTFASAIWSAVLIIGLIIHRSWARYMMIIGLILAIVTFGLITMYMNQESVAFLSRPTKAAIKGMALFGVALIPLGFSRSLRRHCLPLTAGGRTPM
jgi:hypothetical protein